MDSICLYPNLTILLEVDAFPGCHRPSISGIRFARRLVSWAFRGNLVLEGARVADIGCGSGLLGLSAAALGANVVCTDIYPQTPSVIQHNASLNSLEVVGTIGDGLENVLSKQDMLICNPPLIPSPTDLYGRGLLDTIVVEARDVLKPRGMIAFYETSNVGFDVTDALLTNLNYSVIDKVPVTVCLNRAAFWNTYSKLPLSDWERRSQLRSRSGLRFLQGRFMLVQA